MDSQEQYLNSWEFSTAAALLSRVKLLSDDDNEKYSIAT